MPGLEAENVVVAQFGGIFVAPEGTVLPVDAITALPATWINIGYVGEDGVTFSLSRDTEDIMAWQSAEAVRRLITAEPKELSFELLEFDKESVALAFRGGTFAGGLYTPPGPTASAVNAVVVEWQDGDAHWRFGAKRAEISGDVEFQLTRTDAVRLPLTLGILAADDPSWQIASDADSWADGVARSAAKAA